VPSLDTFSSPGYLERALRHTEPGYHSNTLRVSGVQGIGRVSVKVALGFGWSFLCICVPTKHPALAHCKRRPIEE